MVVDPADYEGGARRTGSPGRAGPRVPLRPGAEGVRPHGRLRHGDRRHAHRVRRVARGVRPRGGHGAAMPGRLTVGLTKIRDLRYGENPHQPAAWYGVGSGVRPGRRDRAPGQGIVVHEPARPRLGGAHRARVRGAGRRGDQAHQSVRGRGRRRRGRGVRARPRRRQRWRPSAASSGSTARSTTRRRARWCRPSSRRSSRRR